jgi:hypothetical protein
VGKNLNLSEEAYEDGIKLQYNLADFFYLR